MNVEDSFNDERIIVTDTFIRELEKEILVENTFLQGNFEKILFAKKTFYTSVKSLSFNCATT